MRFAAVPSRSPKDPFLFAVDHCFPIKGQGTVMTGAKHFYLLPNCLMVFQ
jgi:selenocysteine-specific translation elongation factor